MTISDRIEMVIQKAFSRNSSEKRIRDATKPGAKQLIEYQSELFGSQRTFWLLFVRAKSDNEWFGEL